MVTPNYDLPQYVAEDTLNLMNSLNTAFSTIDENMKEISNTATSADSKADAVPAEIAEIQTSIDNIKNEINTINGTEADINNQLLQMRTHVNELTDSATIKGNSVFTGALTHKYIFRVKPVNTFLLAALGNDTARYKIPQEYQAVVKGKRYSVNMITSGLPGTYGIGINSYTPETSTIGDNTELVFQIYNIDDSSKSYNQNTSSYSIIELTVYDL